MGFSSIGNYILVTDMCSFAGVSRSSSCVIAYLMREHGKSYWEALNYTRQQRFIVCPNMGFAKQLQEYEQKIQKRKVEQYVRGTSALKPENTNSYEKEEFKASVGKMNDETIAMINLHNRITSPQKYSQKEE